MHGIKIIDIAGQNLASTMSPVEKSIFPKIFKDFSVEIRSHDSTLDKLRFVSNISKAELFVYPTASVTESSDVFSVVS